MICGKIHESKTEIPQLRSRFRRAEISIQITMFIINNFYFNNTKQKVTYVK